MRLEPPDSKPKGALQGGLRGLPAGYTYTELLLKAKRSNGLDSRPANRASMESRSASLGLLFLC